MRILVVGAGAIGGYFGGRLLEAGPRRDVPGAARGAPRNWRKPAWSSAAHSAMCNLPAPPTVTAETLREPFDLILLSCKAYDLASAADSFAPAVGANTAILPLLNGMAHHGFPCRAFRRAAPCSAANA